MMTVVLHILTIGNNAIQLLNKTSTDLGAFFQLEPDYIPLGSLGSCTQVPYILPLLWPRSCFQAEDVATLQSMLSSTHSSTAFSPSPFSHNISVSGTLESQLTLQQWYVYVLLTISAWLLSLYEASLSVPVGPRECRVPVRWDTRADG